MTTLPEISNECSCGVYYDGRNNPCVPGSPFRTWVSPDRVQAILEGKSVVYDALTMKCIREAIAYYKATRPEEMIYYTLPPEYVAIAKEWADPARRTALLRRMAGSKNLSEFFSPHLSIHDNVRLWIARFRAYVDIVEYVALNNVVAESRGSVANLFYDRF